MKLKFFNYLLYKIMDEKDEIIEEPKVETPDSGNKKKKRRPRKKKE